MGRCISVPVRVISYISGRACFLLRHCFTIFHFCHLFKYLFSLKHHGEQPPGCHIPLGRRQTTWRSGGISPRVPQLRERAAMIGLEPFINGTDDKVQVTCLLETYGHACASAWRDCRLRACCWCFVMRAGAFRCVRCCGQVGTVLRLYNAAQGHVGLMAGGSGLCYIAAVGNRCIAGVQRAEPRGIYRPGTTLDAPGRLRLSGTATRRATIYSAAANISLPPGEQGFRNQVSLSAEPRTLTAGGSTSNKQVAKVTGHPLTLANSVWNMAVWVDRTTHSNNGGTLKFCRS